MIQRNSQPAQFRSGQAVQSQGSSVGNVGPDVDKFSEQRATQELSNDPGTLARTLGAVVGAAAEYAKQAIPKAQEEAYLEGAAKAGIINSEDELEGNFLTRSWKQFGYRDTMGRVAIAQHESTLAEDLKTWREKSPEEFTAYLAERRRALVPQLEGMSPQQRKAAVGNLLLNDQSAIKRHQVEHSKYQLEVEDASINAALRSTVGNLNNEKADMGSYQISTLAAYSTLKSVTADNPKLNRTLKGKYVLKAAEYALESDHQMLYDAIMQTKTELPEGGTGTLASYLDWDDEVKLSKQYRESMKRTEAVRGMKWVDDKASMQADWDNPDTPVQPRAQVLAHAEDGVRRGFMNMDQFGAFMLDYDKAMQKKAIKGTLAQAWVANDVDKVWSLGKTPEEGLEAWRATLGRKMSQPQAVDALVTMGVQGRPEAMREAGKMLAPAIAQLGIGEDINPANASNVAGVLGRLDAAEAKGQTGLFSQLLAPMDDDSKSKVLYVREALRKGLSPTVALSEAQTRITEDGKLTAPQRQAMQASAAKEDVALMQEIEPRGLFASLGLRVKSLWSQEAAAELALRPKKSWSEDEARVNEVSAQAKLAVADELRNIGLRSPYLSVESRRTAALSAVAARTIPTESGPLILPRGLTPERFFGTAANVPKDRIGSAIDEYLKPADGNRMVYTVNSSGQFQFKELNTRSEVVKAGLVDPREVSKLVNAQQDKQAASYNAAHGAGVTVQMPKGAVTFNGDNTAGLDNDVMLSIRKGLVEREGVVDTPYVDSSGSKHRDGKPVMTVGAGISSTNNHYPKPGPDGKIAKADMDRAFLLASNDAAKAAVAFQKKALLPGPSATALFTELFYQSGPGFATAGRDLTKAMQGNDMQAAVQALHATRAYQVAGANRKKYYDGIIFNAMKGQ